MNYEFSNQAYALALRHDNLGMPTTTSGGDDDGDINYYIYEAYGRTPSERAVAVIHEIYSSFRGINTNYDHIFDLILDMPPGYQTTRLINKVLISFPLGLLARKLRNRCMDRFGSPAVFNQLVYSGIVYRIQNVAVEANEPIPNTYRGRFGDPYYPINLSQEVSSFDLQQFPLHKVLFSIPSPNAEDFVGHDRSFIVNTEENNPTFTIGDANLFLPEHYVNLISSFPGGSDVSFFFFSDTGVLLKRYHPVTDAAHTPSVIRTARPFRSAGLRQVLLDNYVGDLMVRNGTVPSGQKFYVPGGSQNCFLASIRWSYIQYQRDQYICDYLDSMDLAQDSDMLMTASPPSFDEESCGRKIDEMIASVLRVRADTDHRHDLNAYLRKYRNGFPTKEINKIAKIFFKRFRIMIAYWRITAYQGRWKNYITYPDEKVKDEELTHLTFIQMSESGAMLDLGVEKEKEGESEDLETISMGMMTHVVAIAPPLPFLRGNHDGKLVSQRKAFRTELDRCLKAYVESIYTVLDYNAEVTYELIDKLVNHQLHRYRLKETKTLIFDLPQTFAAKRARMEKEGSADTPLPRYLAIQAAREFPKIFVFAYDLETVGNLPYIQDRVYPPFRKEVGDDLFRACYQAQYSQIPFSAQYIGVNVDDEECFLQMKIEKDIKPLKYPNSGYGRHHDVFLTPKANTNYGVDQFLGSCVESFLCDIAKYVHAYNGEQAYLFACNGSKFDAYVVLQFQRFEICHILKTSRGILTVSLRVPIDCPPPTLDYDYREDKSPKVTIKLRDISLLVPGSLSSLCVGFNVPSEFTKLDFPIQLVNADNCYHPEIMRICKPYGENDVFSLAFIMKAINRLIGNSTWKPCDPQSEKPPICQFVTCMGMIRKSTKQHFDKVLPISLQPKAVDIPALRTWITNAAIGGRVTAYAKTYVSKFADEILNAAIGENLEELKCLYALMLKSGSCQRTLDFTSLYPYVMDSCPLPMGGLHSIDAQTCRSYIDRMHCEECDRMRCLCPEHRYFYGVNDLQLRPFAIILVKNMKLYPLNDFRNLCPRKTYNSSTSKPLGVLYSLENTQDFSTRMEGKEITRDPQSYTNVDLYWMKRQGFSFEIIGGISFSQLMVYNTFIGPAFKMRIEAKKAGNKLLSDFLKLNYNGSYGVTIQQDITESFFTARLPANLKDHDPRSPEVQKELYAASRSRKNGDGICCSEELTGEGFYLPNGQACFQKKKKDHLAEYYSEQSPLQIGAAILSYARHIGNLILFNVDPKHYTYTDTDSIALTDHVINNDDALCAMINERGDAPMGSLKNDHGDNNGTEPRIFLSLIGAKKVKCHFTLNQEGQIRIFNTFKGLNVSSTKNGVKVNPAFAKYITTKVQFDLNQKCCTDPVNVQSWKRDLQYGVSIGDHLQMFDPNTYLSDHKGLAYFKHEGGEVEYLIPHGMDDGFCDVQVVSDPATGRKEYDRPRKPLYDPELMTKFIQSYFKGCDQVYSPSPEYQEILDLFKAI